MSAPSVLKKRIIHRLEALKWRKSTQSLQVAVLVQGKLALDIRLGPKYKYFDLASLTKVIFTTSLYMHLHQKKTMSVDSKIRKHWADFPFSDVRASDLLSHNARMPAWEPFFRKLRKAKNYREARQRLREALLQIQRRKDRAAVYSDIDFLILAEHLQEALQVPLEVLWSRLKKRLNLSRIHFCRNNKPRYARNLYAPTENCPWRKKTLRGEVHDDNTWALGGVSTHAGLFGDLASVTQFAKLLRDAYLLKKGSPLAANSVAKRFLRRSVSKKDGDWALGYMMPSKKGSSSGRYFSDISVGHTGFTGTSLWFDPQKDIAIVVLSNRVHPKRSNQRFRKLRPLIHDVIIEELLRNNE